MNSFNSFESPEVVKPVAFNGFRFRDNVLTVKIPSKYFLVLELK